MTGPLPRPVASLPNVETGVVFEGTEEWISTLDDPHDTAAQTSPEEAAGS